MIEERVHENNELLRKTLVKLLLSIEPEPNRILFVNMSYAQEQEKQGHYSGMIYIANLRSTMKHASPVIFYGFEDMIRLRKKVDASILNSPAIEYIKMPFKLSELRRVVQRVGQYITEKPLDKKTERSLALERISGIMHDLRNAAILLNQHIQGLKTQENDRKREKWNTLAEFGDDFITKRSERYNKVKEVIESSFPVDRSIRQVPGILKKAEDGYKSLKTVITPGNYTERKLAKIIKKGESVVSMIRKVEIILEKVHRVG